MNRRRPGRSETRNGSRGPLARLTRRDDSRPAGLPGRIVGAVKEAAGERARKAAREVTRPWREGRSGTPAEAGRWLGLGLAVGAAVVGIVGGIYAVTGGFRKGD